MTTKTLFFIGNQQVDYFNTPSEFSDVKISLKNAHGRTRMSDEMMEGFLLDVILYGNKAILSEASPIIKAFLAIEPDSTFIIDEDDEQSIITVNDVIELFKFIYPQFTMKITEQNRKSHPNNLLIVLVIGLIHLSEKYLIETLRNECKKYVFTWLNDLELINCDEKKEFLPRHILYKDGTRKHIASEIGTDSLLGFLFE